MPKSKDLLKRVLIQIPLAYVDNELQITVITA